MSCGKHETAVHVDGVAHGLERIEGDADGQQQPQGGDGRAQQSVQVIDGEVRVFEEAQNGQVAHHGHDQHRLRAALPALGPEMADGQTVAVVKHGGEQHDGDILRLAPAVEQQAAHQQQRVAQPPGADIVQNGGQRQECQQERGAAKDHVAGSPLWMISEELHQFAEKRFTCKRQFFCAGGARGGRSPPRMGSNVAQSLALQGVRGAKRLFSCRRAAQK